jgi:hypothetical protein
MLLTCFGGTCDGTAGSGGDGGLYGGGGGAGSSESVSGTGTFTGRGGTGGAGAQGVIVITYTPATTAGGTTFLMGMEQ